MAKAKKKPVSKKKPAAKTKPAKTKPVKKKPVVKKPVVKKKPANKKPVEDKPVAATAVEKEVAQLLKDNDEGLIDNAFDVIGDMYELDKKLPKTSKLRPAFDAMYSEVSEICAEAAGG